VEVEGVSSNAISDLLRKLRDNHAYLYATPEYLARLGNPTRAQDLKDASLIAYGSLDDMLVHFSSPRPADHAQQHAPPFGRRGGGLAEAFG